MSTAPHLGELIAARIKELGMTKAEFARRIKTSRQNVTLILRKETLATDQVWRINQVLNINLFDVLAEHFASGTEVTTIAQPARMELKLEMAEGKLARSLEAMFRTLMLEAAG